MASDPCSAETVPADDGSECTQPILPFLQQPVIILFGPTASGKTALADSIFSATAPYPLFRGRGEIISADSMQVYCGQNIGTAKPDASLLARLPHHGIDICGQKTQFSAGDFVRIAEQSCAEIAARGHIPVIMGGTAFYIKNFLYGLPVTPESDSSVRSRLKERMKQEGAAVLWNELCLCDPDSAARIHLHDEYRIIRALEIWYTSGKPLSSYSRQGDIRRDARYIVIGIDRPRDELYRRIDRRVDEMFAQGLAAEVRSFIDAGCTADDPGMQAIGYREFFMTPNDTAAAALIRKNTRRYAKRQLTFFKALPGVHWFNAGDTDGVYRFLAETIGRD